MVRAGGRAVFTRSDAAVDDEKLNLFDFARRRAAIGAQMREENSRGLPFPLRAERADEG